MKKETRRSLLKGVALVSPAIWAKPVIQSVILPAHAETSMQITELSASLRFYTDSSFSTEIPNESLITIGDSYVVVITLSPSPGVPIDVEVQTSIDDVPNPPVNGTTSSEGVIALQIAEAGNNDMGNDGRRERFVDISVPRRFSFSDANFADAFFLLLGAT